MFEEMPIAKNEDNYKNSARFKCQQAMVFILTFLGYASFHACRQCFADTQSDMEDQWEGFTDTFCGTMDGLFLFVYAIGLFGGGLIGDKFDAVKVHSFGLISMSFIYIIFASAIPYFNFNQKWFFVILWIINGFVQSLGWPTAVKIMANWFAGEHDGIIFGLWAGCQYVGNIMGSAYDSYVSSNNYAIQWNFYLPAAQAGIVGISCFLFIRTYPNKYESNLVDTKNVNDAIATVGIKNNKQSTSIGLLQAIKLPDVLSYGLTYACLKGVNYTLFWWLPYFLDPTFGDSRSDDLSMYFNVGQIFGGTICGYISDQFPKRSPPMMVFLILAIPPLFMLHVPFASYAFVAALTSLSGFFIGGPANFIPSIVAAEVGRMEASKNNPASLSTITGLIDGMGSFGAAICVYATTFISQGFGKGVVFVILSCLILLAAALMTPLTWRDIKFIRQGRNQSQMDDNSQSQLNESMIGAQQSE